MRGIEIGVDFCIDISSTQEMENGGKQNEIRFWDGQRNCHIDWLLHNLYGKYSGITDVPF